MKKWVGTSTAARLTRNASATPVVPKKYASNTSRTRPRAFPTVLPATSPNVLSVADGGGLSATRRATVTSLSDRPVGERCEELGIRRDGLLHRERRLHSVAPCRTDPL